MPGFNMKETEWSRNLWERCRKVLQLHDARITALEQGGGALPSTTTYVSGVKSDAESAYRSGNVNLTADDTGALDSSDLPKSATISVTATTAGLIPFTGITPTSIISATSNGYVIIPCKTSTGSWRGVVTDLALNIVTSQPTITVNVLYY